MRKNTMKINTLAKKITAAFALLTTVLLANAGDIYSIDLVSQYYGTIPTAGKPLVAGEKAVVRVRLINRDYDTVGKAWSFLPNSTSWAAMGSDMLKSMYAPAFGFSFGGSSTVWAQYLDTVPVPSPANTYTDIFFEYDVQPGDLAMPALFMLKPGSASEYYLRNSNIWSLSNESGDTISLSFATDAEVDGPTGVNSIRGKPSDQVKRMKDATGEMLGLYVKSVDFDENYVDAKNKIWRNVGLDDTETSNGVQPAITVTGGDLTSAVTMYVWVDDESVAVPDPDKSYDHSQTIGSTTITRKMLAVTIDAGKSSQTFKLYGKSKGTTANVCMSSSEDFLLKKGSSTTIATNWVSRAIGVVALDPSVSLTFKDTGGTATSDLRCSADYTQPIATLEVRLSTSPTNDVEVAIAPTPLDIYDNLRLTESSNVLEQPWESPVSNVTFLASTTDLTKTLFVYALGSTTNYENTATKFTPSVAGSDQYTKINTSSVTLRRAKPTVAALKSSIGDAVLGEDYNLDITVGGSYDDLKGAGKDKWIFHYKVKSGTKYGSEYVTTNTVSVSGSDVTGKFTAKINKESLKLSATALEIWVTSPSQVDSDAITVPLAVQPGLEAWARFGSVSGSPLGTYGEGDVSADIFFSISSDESKTVWAFLKPEDDSITNKMDCAAFTTLGTNSKGIAIEKGMTNSLLSAKITMLDGDASGNFTVVICSTNVYDSTKTLGYVGDAVLTAVATNIVPHATKAKQGNYFANNGGTLSGTVPLHIDREFKVDVFEPSKTDREGKDNSSTPGGKDERFITEWRFDDDSSCSDTTYSNNGQGWYTIYGDPATTNIHHTFHTPGVHTVTVRCRDKDMGSGVYSEEFSFNVVVDDEPVVVIKPVSGGTTYYEDMAGPDESMFSVSLVGAPYITSNEVLKVKIEVEKAGTSSNYSTNDVVLSTNMVTFASGKTGSGTGTDALRTFYFKELNGTAGSAAEGFLIKATVMNAAADADGKTWGVGTYNVYIRNRNPVILSPVAEDQVDADGSPIINDTNIGNVIEIPWTVNDVAADRTNLTVTCTTSEGKIITTNTVAGVSGKFGVSFDDSGDKKTIKITVTDKDFGSSSVTLYYKIAASKVLKLAANGPSDGDSAITLSTLYARAAGSGEGRVFVESAGGTVSCSRAVDFKLFWTCGLKTSVDAYGYGYECKDVDNGSLTKNGEYGDVALTVNGGKAEPTETNFYTYSGDDLRGSYFYGWLTQTDPGAIGTTYTLNPAFELRGSKKRTSTGGSINLPQDLTEDDAGYAQTYAEGIFSKEHHRTDNMGDINDDGVPDYYATYDFKGGKLAEVDGQGGELLGVNTSNADDDYYPSSSQLGASTLIPGAISGWSTRGNAFDAAAEIRGYHEGINFGMFKYNADERKYGWVSDLYLSDNEKRSLLTHAFDRRDDILKSVREKNGGDWDDYVTNNRWGDYEKDDWTAITNLLSTVVRAGASHKTGFDPVYYDIGDWMANATIVAVPETNIVGGVEVVTTNDCWQYIYTNTGLMPATNIVKMVVSTFTNTILNAEVTVTNNPCDYITLDNVNIGDWLSVVASTPDLTNRAEQVAAKAYIDRTWHRYISEGRPGWTCENRTDPTVDDTDGDEIPDGYEYFIWYDAKIGTKGTNRLVGCRFDRADIESREDVITSDEIAKIYDPNVKGTNWKSLDTDNDGISDYEEFLIGTSPVDWDTDRDGLSDLYEVMYNINPLTIEPGVNDGAMNGDGDFMAYAHDELTEFAPYSNVYKATDGKLWMLFNDFTTQLAGALIVDPETNSVSLTGFGFEVASFNGGYIPTVEDTSRGNFGPNTVTIDVDPRDEVVTGKTVSFYHSQVYNYFGFDPRTAWFKDANGSCSPRFGSTQAPAVNTSAFTAKDEYLLLKFRYIVGLRSYAEDTTNLKNGKTTIYSIIVNGTTNPNGNFSEKQWGDSETKYTQNQHGADTDGDGVPDGWELYLGIDPNRKYTIAKGSTGYDPLYYSRIVSPDGEEGDDGDGLGLAAEYAGTDSCGFYSGCSTVYANYPTVDGSLIKGWMNKYWPTDPMERDTDQDGLTDSQEGRNWAGDYTMNRWGQDNNRSKETTTISGVRYYMIYGEPVDNATTCIKGGGFNPCTIDTDGDGLPDKWEHQYAGLLFLNDEIVTEANTGVEDFFVFDPDNGVPTGAYDDIRAAASALGWDFSLYTNDVLHVVMGQDGTVSDAYSFTGYKAADRDWDGDGLQNWQEYLVQAMRHFRYDDCKTPLMGRDIPVANRTTGTIDNGAWNGDKGFPQISVTSPLTSGELLTLQELGYTNFVSYVKSHSSYLSTLGYFAAPPKSWDPYSGYVYMLPPRTDVEIAAKDWTEDPVQGTNTTGHTIWAYRSSNGYTNWVDSATYAGLVVTNSVAKDSTGNDVGIYRGPAPTTPYSQDEILLWQDMNGTNYYVAVDTSSTNMVGGVMTNYYFDTVARLQVGVETNTVGLGVYSLYYSASKYVGTDPRLWDTDEDGMDDYYELFHGLNPILGNVGSSVGSDDAKDVISAAYGSVVSAWRNAWIGWDNTTRPEYDAIKYPWMIGEGLCDADGDGLRNEEESITANFTPPMTYHTDPTPLWMTDATVGYESYVGVSTEVLTNDTGRTERDPSTGIRVPVLDIVTNQVFGSEVKLFDSPSFTKLFYENQGITAAFAPSGAYYYSFEENEGYDTDNDWRSDSIEMRQTVEPTSDPLDSGDVVRRQSIWFGGASKPGVAISYEPSRRNTFGYDFYKQFTVEAWIRPSNPKTGADQYVVSRASKYPGWDADHPNDVIRMNFAIGCDANGAIFGEMQDSAETTFRLTGGNPAADKWTHVAATYDGNTFTLYVDGVYVDSQKTGLIPANGVTDPIQDPQFTGAFPYEKETYTIVPSITILGARAVGDGAFDVDVAGSASGWTGIADDFFGGSVDEVRIWDGARSADVIKQNYNVRYDSQTVKDIRQSIYAQYRSGKRRNTGTLDPELVQHYGFGSLPGAADEKYVQRVPAGLKVNVLDLVRNPETGTAVNDAILNVGWWAPIATNPAIGSVYSSTHVVPWIENTVGHLPRLCGSLADSVYWSENFAGFTPAKFHDLDKYEISNSMNPYNLVSVGDEERFANQKTHRLAQAAYAGGGATAADNQTIRNKYLYDSRMSFSGTTDLVPLGSAFAKRLDESWDGQGAEDAWAITTSGSGELDGDPNDSGMPAWASVAYGADTQLYAFWLSRGATPSDTNPSSSSFESMADINGNSIPDWWEKFYGVEGCEAIDDNDNDGLSNYQEYLISYGPDPFGYYRSGAVAYALDPTNPRSTGAAVLDYFLAPPVASTSTKQHIHTNEYLGEIVTDHDFMETMWESLHGLDYCNPNIYDSFLDKDGDGWDNFSEVRSFYWHGGYMSDLIDNYYAGNAGNHFYDFPHPTIAVRATYNGIRDCRAKSLVVRVKTDKYPRVDATFVAAGTEELESNNAGGTVYHMIGTYPGPVVVHGTLHPGHVSPGSSTKFQRRLIDIETKIKWHCDICEPLCPTHCVSFSGEQCILNGYFIGTQEQFDRHYEGHNSKTEGNEDTVESLGPVVPNYETFAETTSDTEGRYGQILTTDGASKGSVVGTIDFRTGEYDLDLKALEKAGISLNGFLIRVAYSYHIGDEWPKTVWLSDTTIAGGEGYVRQGKNDIEAFIDLNSNNKWEDGEPYGYVRDVEIGWHKTAKPIVIELKDKSSVFDPMAIGSASDNDQSTSSLTSEVVVRRTAINGVAALERKIVGRTVINDDRAYITEADVVSMAGYDMDWANLAKDAKDQIESATYEVEVDGEVAGAYTRLFSKNRPVAAPLAPSATAPVYSAHPSFIFNTTDETMTAYQIQVATNSNTESVVWTSPIAVLPGRTPYTTAFPAAYEVSPDLYVDFAKSASGDVVLHNTTNYFWRVALLNAKYPETDDTAWSDWCEFLPDLSNELIHPKTMTGYGKVGAIVRYFGPGAYIPQNVVVEAYATADFTGLPLAKLRLSGSVTDLGDRNSLETPNVTLSGVETGDVFIRAFIDSNDNCVLDAWESWGYANNLGQVTEFLYTPRAVEVVDSITNVSSIVVFIEDTDRNQNEVPDILEIAKFNSADSDGDGMPDGWEGWAGTDPLAPDADFVVEGDVMACVELSAKLITLADGTKYILDLDEIRTPAVGDISTNYSYNTWYEYGSALRYGIGASATVPVTTIAEVRDITAVLVHSQVYDKYGFSPNTANTVAYANGTSVNTKPFTAIDKYLVVRYLESLGLANEAAMIASGTWSASTLRPALVDSNFDGIPDGWELYTMFGTGGTTTTLSAAKVSPWKDADYVRDVANSPDGGTLSILGEYDNGLVPTDPWRTDTDDDGILDTYAARYHLKGGKFDADPDRDGLSNYQEYLISVVYTNLVPRYTLDPDNAHSVSKAVPDYFLRHNKLYYGELFADHDHIEDWWEDAQPSVTTRGGTVLANYSRFVYDANTDVLGNGWDNWSLARAWFDGAYPTNIVQTLTDADTGLSVVVTNTTMSSTLVDNGGVPSPVVPIRVTYHGKLGNLGNKSTKYQIVIKAWSMENGNDPYMLGSPDKTWGMSVPSQNTLDVEGTAVGFSAKGGAIRPGRNMFVAYVAEGEFEEGTPAPAYEPGMPYGVASGVVVGPISGANVNIEMTDVNYAMPRIDIGKAIKIQDTYAETVGGGDADRQACFNEMSMECTDRGRWAPDLLTAVNPYVGTDMHGAASNEVEQVRVRIVRSGINDAFSMGELQLSGSEPIIDRTFPLAAHSVLSEADLLADPELGYDIDWGGPRQVFYESNQGWPGITNAYYRVVLFDGTIENEEDNNNLCVMFVNRFEVGKSQTAVTNMEVRTYSGQPTFSWQHPNTIDKAYPAFQLRVWDGTTCVFDSGVQRAPVRDAAGRYNWTAPLWVGSITSSNKVFEANKKYTWSVSMLDAKFITPASNEAKADFSMQETSPSGGSSDYGIIPVTVKYLGPGTVNIATNYTQCLRVEAYRTPDFIGMPSGVGFVYDDTDLSSTNKNSVNAMVYGLPADTPYYLRAYIDTNGNGALDAWESWGYACYRGSSGRSDFFTPRAVMAANAATVDDCTIYVEDSDTNHNMVPDILEKEAAGGTFLNKMLSPYIAYGKHNEAAKIAAVDDAAAGANGNAMTLKAAPRKLFAYATALNAVSSGYVTPGLYAVATGDVTVETEDSAHIKITSFSLETGVTLDIVVDSSFASATTAGFDTGYIKVGAEYATTLENGGDWKSAGVPDTISFPLTPGTTTVEADSLSGVKAAIESVKKTQSGACYFRVSAVAFE